jgi:nucleoside-diphosphate-sugar epimerase
MNKRILLLGGAGLVGQNLVVRLKARGFTNIAVLDKHRANLDLLRSIHSDVETVFTDLAEPEPWSAYFDGAEVVVMLQGQIGAATRHPFIRNNVLSTRNVLAAMRRFKVPYVVHISSSVVTSVAKDLYSETKREQEKLVIDSGIDFVVLRPTLMFGWFDRKHLGWLSRFMRRVPVFPIPGNGHYIRQPLYVGDFCEMIISCIESRITGSIFNITGLERIYYIDMIRQVKRATGARCALVRIPYGIFHLLLRSYAIVDRNPPFTAEQLEALTAGDEFAVIDWERIFKITATPLEKAMDQTFKDPTYSHIALRF